MKQMSFISIEELAEYMVNSAQDHEMVTAALFFDRADELMRELLQYGFGVDMIELSSPEWFEYEKEYYVTLTGEKTLTVEKAYDDSCGYLNTYSEIMLLDGDVSYDIARTNKFSECIEICFGYSKDFDDDACCEDGCQDCCNCNESDSDESWIDYLFEHVEVFNDENDIPTWIGMDFGVFIDFLFDIYPNLY